MELGSKSLPQAMDSPVLNILWYSADVFIVQALQERGSDKVDCIGCPGTTKEQWF